MKADYWVLKRPGLDKFLQEMSEVFDIVIYTTAVREYAETVISELGIKKYVSRLFYRNQIGSEIPISTLKDLSLVGADMKRMILIDDARRNTTRYSDNSILLPPFKGNQKDKWLSLLRPFLQKIVEYEDVRSVGKRFNTYMMDNEIPRYFALEPAKISNDSKDLSSISSIAVLDDTCLDEAEDGLTQTARIQVQANASPSSFSKKILETPTTSTTV